MGQGRLPGIDLTSLQSRPASFHLDRLSCGFPCLFYSWGFLPRHMVSPCKAEREWGRTPADGHFLARKSKSVAAPNSALTSARPMEGLEVEGFQAKYRGEPLRNSIPCPSPSLWAFHVVV